MDPTKPIGNIKPQANTSSPIASQSVLVDDTVFLVDDTTALTGSQTDTIQALRVNVSPTAPKGSIKLRR